MKYGTEEGEVCGRDGCAGNVMTELMSLDDIEHHKMAFEEVDSLDFFWICETARAAHELKAAGDKLTADVVRYMSDLCKLTEENKKLHKGFNNTIESRLYWRQKYDAIREENEKLREDFIALATMASATEERNSYLLEQLHVARAEERERCAKECDKRVVLAGGWGHCAAQLAYVIRALGDAAPVYDRHATLGTTQCHSNNDGECSWSGCPQLRDGEPNASGRHCPLDTNAGDAE